MNLERIIEEYPNILIINDYDDAIIGLAERIGMEPVIAYDRNKVIDILAKDMNITLSDLSDSELNNGISLQDKKYELAEEYFEYNIAGAYMGEFTPIFINTNYIYD